MLNVERFESMLRDGLIVSGQWSEFAPDGRKMLCALSALSDDVQEARSATACPAEDCQPWIAHLVPWIDDAPSDADARGPIWRGFMDRLGPIARRVAMPEYQEALRRADYACRAVAVRDLEIID